MLNLHGYDRCRPTGWWVLWKLYLRKLGLFQELLGQKYEFCLLLHSAKDWSRIGLRCTQEA